jgi:hypothetical protein
MEVTIANSSVGGESVEFGVETSIAKTRSLRALRFGEQSLTAIDISKSTSRDDKNRKGLSKHTGWPLNGDDGPMTRGPTGIFAEVKRRGTVPVRQLEAEFGSDSS